MKRYLVLLTAMTVMTFCLTACAQNKQKAKEMEQKALVVYFSATGTTEGVAHKLAQALPADLLEIKPAQPYTDADLDWRDKSSRSSVEMADSQSRPAIKPDTVDTDRYEVIFIGYPIWWDLAPTVVNTFIESKRLKGKTVIPFATSGGSSIRNSAAQLKKLYPEINWKEGKLLNGFNEKAISQWVEKLDL